MAWTDDDAKKADEKAEIARQELKALLDNPALKDGAKALVTWLSVHRMATYKRLMKVLYEEAL